MNEINEKFSFKMGVNLLLHSISEGFLDILQASVYKKAGTKTAINMKKFPNSNIEHSHKQIRIKENKNKG